MKTQYKKPPRVKDKPSGNGDKTRSPRTYTAKKKTKKKKPGRKKA